MEQDLHIGRFCEGTVLSIRKRLGKLRCYDLVVADDKQSLIRHSYLSPRHEAMIAEKSF
jgi:hypothetical protein